MSMPIPQNVQEMLSELQRLQEEVQQLRQEKQAWLKEEKEIRRQLVMMRGF